MTMMKILEQKKSIELFRGSASNGDRRANGFGSFTSNDHLHDRGSSGQIGPARSSTWSNGGMGCNSASEESSIRSEAFRSLDIRRNCDFFLVTAALIACLLPASRAAACRPMDALRFE
jgi:hypothetical protein